MKSYIKGFFHGLGSLLTGLKVTGREFFTPKVTEQYPENRATLRMFDRFCGEPNGTIRITTEMVADPETGKSRKRLVLYEYDLGACMFCRLCVNACPTGAIRFSTDFEHAVYTREKLVKTLNKR